MSDSSFYEMIQDEFLACSWNWKPEIWSNRALTIKILLPHDRVFFNFEVISPAPKIRKHDFGLVNKKQDKLRFVRIMALCVVGAIGFVKVRTTREGVFNHPTMGNWQSKMERLAREYFLFNKLSCILLCSACYPGIF